MKTIYLKYHLQCQFLRNKMCRLHIFSISISFPFQVNNDQKSHLLLLPYSGPKCAKLIRSLKKALKSKLPDNIVTKSAYSAMRLKGKFNTTTKTVKEHQHDITCYVECPEENCDENYVGETRRRLSERVIDHNGWDKTFHIFKHLVEREHRRPSLQEFSILGGNYCKNKFGRKVTGASLIKGKQSTLNTQQKSIPVKLFN